MMNSAPADIVVYRRDKGEVLREKSLMAFSKDKIVAVGNECENLQNLTDEQRDSLVVISPFKQGEIDDFSCALRLLRYFLYKAQGKKKPFARRPVIGICLPEKMTMVNIKAFEDAIYGAGAKECRIFYDSVENVLKDWKSEDKKKTDIIIAMEKDNPLEYLQEKISDVLDFAEKNHISRETVKELLDK